MLTGEMYSFWLVEISPYRARHNQWGLPKEEEERQESDKQQWVEEREWGQFILMSIYWTTAIYWDSVFCLQGVDIKANGSN